MRISIDDFSTGVIVLSAAFLMGTAIKDQDYTECIAWAGAIVLATLRNKRSE